MLTGGFQIPDQVGNDGLKVGNDGLKVGNDGLKVRNDGLKVGKTLGYRALMSHLALSLLKSNFARVGVLSATE